MAMILKTQTDVINVNTLLPEMTSLETLARRPKYAYKAMQASSYDRKSVAPDKPDWFANDDWGQYIRDEVNNGRKEHVMADIQGAGVVTRVWSANPAGTIRFYFDGSTQPKIECTLADLLAGKVAPFNEPFAYEASHGHDLYFPIPFAKSLKVTVDDTQAGADRLYYHVGYRVYGPGVTVETFDPSKIDMDLVQRVAHDLVNPLDAPTTYSQQLHIPAGESKHFPKLNATTPLAITRMTFGVANTPTDWSNPSAVQRVLRNLILDISFDGEPCVRAPLSDFFNNVPALKPYASLPMSVSADGKLTCRFVMPFQKEALIRISNEGRAAADVTCEAALEPFTFDDATYHFHSQWKAEIGPTRPMRDMEFMNVKGEGRFVGASMVERNPSPAWWGEGDEKAYVDGESFPSTFGTGNEDYFGYAWGSNEPFQKSYHGQPFAQGPLSFGYSCQHRWHIFDCIPFSNAFKFDIELWHWAEKEQHYSSWNTSYWYARPGSTPPVEIDRSGLALEPLDAPRVEGTIEGEDMKVVSASGGTTETQILEQCSNFQQVWWHEGKVGDKLVLEFDAPSDGTYHVMANCCTNNDYGHHSITMNGEPGGEFDFYGEKLDWRVVDFGTHALHKGPNRIEVTVLQPNPKAEPKNMFGLDYILLKS